MISAQFHLEGYVTPYRLDRNANGGNIPFYKRWDIPPRLIISDLSIERFFQEIKLRKKKEYGSFAALTVLRRT